MIQTTDKYTSLLPTVTSEIGADSMRHYIDEKGNRYPSVTTMLKKTNNSKGLSEWRERVGEREAKRTMSQACELGTAVHELAEKHLKGIVEIPPKKVVDPLPKMMFNGLKPYLDSHITTVYGVEVPLFSRAIELGGCIDCVAFWDGVPAIIDFKTSQRPKQREWITDYFLQATAYKILWEEQTKQYIDKIVILVTTVDGITQIFAENPNVYITPLLQRIRKYMTLCTV